MDIIEQKIIPYENQDKPLSRELILRSRSEIVSRQYYVGTADSENESAQTTFSNELVSLNLSDLDILRNLHERVQRIHIEAAKVVV